MKCKCPVCKGSGEIEVKPKIDNSELVKAAKSLKKKGFKIRQIMTLLGYKHPGSISHLLSKK